jgi:hypothetical protein
MLLTLQNIFLSLHTSNQAENENKKKKTRERAHNNNKTDCIKSNDETLAFLVGIEALL